MKQFQCRAITGKVYGIEEIAQRFPGSVKAVCNLDVGQEAVDCDDDRWVRLPDLVAVTEPARDERLERIATAALQGLCANSYDGHKNRPLSTASYAEMAECAVGHARALIAELDKQA